ncbi:MAG: hypothetical protein KA713_12385 [Chryseotalea sp. WA131a]|jgi:hypothetical protein|nr:MAG: hypothetical protein KA713_12385 [Chryseotalea sp. WA131a]
MKFKAMETVQIKIINPKAKKLLSGMEDLKLIRINVADNLFPLTDEQKKSITMSRKQIKKGDFKEHGVVMKSAREWIKGK